MGKGPDFFVDINPWERQKAAVFAEVKDIASFIPRVRMDAFWQKSLKDMHNHVEVASSASVIMDNYAKNYNDQIGASLQVDWALGDNHYLVTGYEFNKDRLDATTNTRTNVRPNSMIQVQQDTIYKYEGDMKTHALFGQMESKLPWDLTFVYGVRQTWVNSTMDRAWGHNTTSTTMTMPPFYNPITRVTSGLTDAGVESSTWESQPVFNAGIM